jgi:translocation and assembly module TamB
MSDKHFNRMKKIVKHILRGLSIAFVSLLGLILLILIALQTPFAKSKLADFAELQVEKNLNAHLDIGKVEGNFINGLNLKQVTFITSTDTMAKIQSLKVKYQLLPLLSGKIVVNTAEINRPEFRLEQYKDGSWNFEHLAKPRKESPKKVSPFSMKVTVENFRLNNARLQLLSKNKMLPKRISDFYVGGSGEYSVGHFKINLKNFCFNAKQPNLQIKNLHFRLEQQNENFQLSDFILQTPKNKLTAHAKIDISFSETSTLTFKTEPLFLDEFSSFLPSGYDIKIHPEIQLSTVLEEQNLQLALKLSDRAETLHISVFSPQIGTILQKNKLADNAAFIVKAEFDQIQLNNWIKMNAPYFCINGQMLIKSKGLSLDTLAASVQGNFKNLKIDEQIVDQLTFNFDYKSKNLKGELLGNGESGRIFLKSEIKHLNDNKPEYYLSLATQKLDISSFFPAVNGLSKLNMRVSVHGSGFEPNKMTAIGQINIDSTSFSGFNIHSLQAKLQFFRQNLLIESLTAETESAHLAANGIYSLNGNSDANLNLTLDNASEIKKITGIEELGIRGNLSVHLTGTPKKLQTQLSTTLFDTQFQTYKIGEIMAQINADILDGHSIFANGEVDAKNLLLNGTELQNIHLNGQSDRKKMQLSVNAAGEDLKTSFNSLIQFPIPSVIEMSDFQLNYKNNHWKQDTSSVRLIITDNNYNLQHLKLISDDTDSVQTIFAEGKISTKGNQDFHLSLSNLNLSKIYNLFSSPDKSIQGKLNFEARLKGNAFSPEANIAINTDNIGVQNFIIGNLKGKVQFSDQKLNTKVNVNFADSGQLTVNGWLPLIVRLDSLQFGWPTSDNSFMNLDLSAKKIPLSLLKSFLPTGEFNGLIQSKLHAEGKLREPDLNGTLEIINGQIKMPQYGINYPLVKANILLDNNNIKIDTFLIKSREGRMTVDGNINPSALVKKSSISNSLSGLQMRFKEFNPIDHKNYNVTVSGDAALKGTTDSIIFSGDLNIPRSEINLPSVLQLMGKTSAPQLPEPLLVEELKKIQVEDSIIIALSPAKSTQKAEKSELSKKLQGNLRVKIPRNTWIKNQDMRVELSGDVELMKHRDFFELFGTVEVLRGQYNLMGKLFIIESGTIAFQGGEKINPVLNFQAAYNFRDPNREQKKLVAHISGEMLAPEIKFTMDEQAIAEGDALSYILFGARMDALTTGQRENMNQTFDALGLTESLAASSLSSQLTKILNKTLNVDYIEVKSKGSFESGSVEIGKYLTNKLFLSYSRNFGNYQNDETISEYEVKAEYEIFKFLFLQLTSSPVRNGIDIVFKKVSK